MKEQEIKYSIIRYLDGEMSNDEKQDLLSWINLNKNNTKYFIEVKDIWEATILEANEISQTPKEWNKFKNLVKESSRSINSHLKSTLKIWQSSAAVLVMALSVLGWYLYQQIDYTNSLSENKIQTIVPSGEKCQLVLPDSTKVWINSGSTLSYNAAFGLPDRKVALSGEAYFEVHRNTESPFTVETKDCEVKVLGTKFNVSSYKTSSHTETSLKEGSVEVILHNGDMVELKPGQVARAQNSTGELTVFEHDINNLICWKENILKFNNTSLTDVVERLSRWYGIQVHLSNQDMLADKRFTFTVKTESLNELLSIVELVQPMNYNIKGDHLYIEITK